MRGGGFREERAWERAALVAACAINPHLKKPVTPNQLLGRKEPITVKDPGAKEAELWNRLEKMAEQEG